MLKTYLMSLNMLYMQSKWFIFYLAVASSIHVTLHVLFRCVHFNPKWTDIEILVSCFNKRAKLSYITNINRIIKCNK